jgi:FkbH-like protein
MKSSDFRREWAQYAASGHSSSQERLDIAVCGSITAEPIEPYIGAQLLRKGFSPTITIGPFGQLWQICYDFRAVFESKRLDAIVLLWRIEDLFPRLLSKSLNDASALESLQTEVNRFAQAVAQLRQSFTGTIVVSTPPYPSCPGFDLTAVGQAAKTMALFSSIYDRWMEAMSRVERVRVFDLHGLLLKLGFVPSHDMRKWLLYRQPYAEQLWCEAGRVVGRILAAERVGPKKCVVLDLDNTLWGGIVGEDGLEGIQLSEEFPGKAYRDFQRYLLHLKNSGILLAVASRNNADDAHEVFQKHDGMVLSRGDIAAFEVHWESKVESVKRIAATLNIGLDSMVFVDDNPKEIAEVMSRLPEVVCVTVPEELANLPNVLAEMELFDSAEVTDEDRRRTEMIAANIARTHRQSVMSEEEFRESLELAIEVFVVERQHLARVAQLINKTNQFNLTTVRRTQTEVEELVNSNDTLVLGMRVSDKYGDYGLVGVAILKRRDRTCLIDTLLMSCRVLGRGAEAALIAAIGEGAAALGCQELRGTYIASAKNAMVKDLYPRFNFRPRGEDEWMINISELPSPLPHVRVSVRVEGLTNRHEQVGQYG